MSGNTTEDDSDSLIIAQWIAMDNAKQEASINSLLSDTDGKSPLKKKIREDNIIDVDTYVYSQQYSQVELSDEENYAVPIGSTCVAVPKAVGKNRCLSQFEYIVSNYYAED